MCLKSLLAMHGVEQAGCEIVVVDNSDESSAQQAVEGCRALSVVPVRYVAAHPANIAVARNQGVLHARGRFIAMIDDDMTVAPSWLAAVLPLLQSQAYDVLCGPVEPVYEDQSRATAESDAFFLRQMDVAGVTPLRIMGPARTRSFIPATSNAIFNRERCFAGGPPFDTHYGKSGGEDVDVFCRLEREGRTFAWVPQALTREHVPLRRCELDYLEKRSFVGGQIFASTYVRNAGTPQYVAAKISIIAWLQLLFLAFKTLWVGPAGTQSHTAWRLRRAAVRGKLAWRSMVPIYSDEQSKRAGAQA